MTLLPFRREPAPLSIPAPAEFGEFWAAYPRHVGKLAAIKAYAAARKLASAEDILAGVERYKASKPAYADWCHPSTFLAQGRWMDEDDTPRVQQVQVQDWRCQHQPACYNVSAHMVRLAKERGEV